MSFNYKTKTISFTSGKGGVGKTTIASNVAYYLSRLGKKVLIFDADLGMANVDIFFGTRANKTIVDVIDGKCKMRDILTPLEPNLFLISGGHGIEKLQDMDSFTRRSLLDSLNEFQNIFDYMIIDTAPGLSNNVLQINSSAQTVNVIITPEPASFADSYALIKVLHQKYKINNFKIICNQVRSKDDGFHLFGRFQDVVQKFLNVGLSFSGTIPLDNQMRVLNHEQRLIMKQSMESNAINSLTEIADEILNSHNKIGSRGGLQLFWENYCQVSNA